MGEASGAAGGARGTEPRAAHCRLPLPVYALAPLLALVLPAYLLATNYALVDQSRNTQMISGWRQLLAEPVPSGTILVSNDRDEMTPLWYYQYVDGLRRDLTGLFPLIHPSPAFADIGGVVDAALASGRPVWLVKPMPGLEVKYRLAPAGSRVRVLGRAGAQPPERPVDVGYGSALRLTGYDVAAHVRHAAGERPGRAHVLLAGAAAADGRLYQLRASCERRRRCRRPG